ncbi:golgi apyrase [Fusarium sporotrichioides]|uniref:Golgi apyrase n=1 Tax=Fusarium sporotrichioides TaxID=5514 RepID=A0A395RK55_FUSSP|nr:golgi apyrase [Fusarium sporotrichioides]
MQRSSNDRFEPQTQLVLGVSSPSSSSSSLFGGIFPRSIIGPANKPASVFALIKNRLSVQKQRKLGNMGLLKGSDLRAKFKAREATSEGQGKAIISAPSFVALQQHSLVNPNGQVYENRQLSSQRPVQYSKLGQQHEPLGFHPVHITTGDRYNGDDSTSWDSVLSDWGIPCHYGTQTEPRGSSSILRSQPKADSLINTPDSSPDDICPVHSIRDTRIRQLCEKPSLGREEREELAKAVVDLELHIEQATIAANMYFHQAHGWEVRSPVPDDLDSLPQMLQGLYTVMIWMQQRIQVYETMFPGLRREYD